jgi:transposase
LAGRRRVVHALIFTAVYSRHMFVWLTFAQTLQAIIAGCEAAWRFFGGVFGVLSAATQPVAAFQRTEAGPPRPRARGCLVRALVRNARSWSCARVDLAGGDPR